MPTENPPSTPETKTAYDWNDDPRTMILVVSWSDFGWSAHRQGIKVNRDSLITFEQFRQIRSGSGAAVTVRTRPGFDYVTAIEAEKRR